MQVQKHPDDIEYWKHLQERLKYLAYCMNLHACDDLGRLRRPRSLNTYSALFKNQASLQRKTKEGTP